MKKKIISVITIILIMVFGLLACSNSSNSSNSPNRNDNPEYVVLIGEDREHLAGFPCADTLVIDGEYFTAEDVSYLKEKGVKTIYSYLNIGSIEEFRDCYEKYSEYALGEYENWPDEMWMDVSQEEWRNYIISKGNELAEKGFDGFFIDNADVYYMFQTREIYDGIVDILTRLKRGNMDVIINGGDVFVQEYIASGEQNGKIFDGVNQEDVYTNYNFEENRFEINTEENREYYREYLEGLLSKGYTVYVLEYADKKEIQKKAIAYAKDKGFIVYAADNIDLQGARK